ncbi:MAG: cobalamin-dependent protein [Anaerolineae bacterium]|nr:cobalamin-dependent protein [Anaerolineae bacterium]
MNTLNQQASATINTQRDALAEALVARQYQLQSEFWNRFGETGRAKSVRDAGYHLTYLSEALAAGDPTLFVEYVVWAKTLFAGLNFPDDVLPQSLDCMRAVFQTMLPDDVRALADEYVQAALDALARAPTQPTSFIQTDTPLGALARAYLDALLRGERHTARDLILDAVERGASVKDIYLRVFQPVQQEIGRLWQMNQISVAQEHYCTAATQVIMSQLYPRIFSGTKIGRKLVVTCVSGELHEMGARMVADFFEMEGWDTYFLGANTPTDAILRTLDERRADVLAISVTMTFHIHLVTELIERVRAASLSRPPKILVGGYPFNLSPHLWRAVKADAYARDAQQAIQVAHSVLR